MDNDALKHAWQLIEQGFIEEGGSVLVNTLAYKREEDAWAWLYSCVKPTSQKIYCIKKILELNPSHQKAQNALVEIQLREAFATDQLGIQNNEKTGIGTQASKENEKAHEKYTPTEIPKQSSRELIGKPKTDTGYRQELLPSFDAAILNTNTLKSETTSTKPLKRKLNRKKSHTGKSNRESNNNELQESAKTIDRIVITPKPARIIHNRPSDNLFSESNYHRSFPQFDSGMFGRRLLINGIAITSFDHPHCVETGQIPHKSHCHNCEFFSVSDCPIRRDPIILHDAITIFAQHNRYSQEHNERKQSIIEAVFTELREHGRPLHYEVISRILHDRYPKLRVNSRKVLQLMRWHPEKFEWVDRGVFKAK